MDQNEQAVSDSGSYYLGGKINETSTKPVINWLLRHNGDSQPTLKRLTLFINSYGGSLTDGFAVVDMLKGSKLPVHTVGIGAVCSAGLLIFISGEHRILTPNTSILSHQYWWGTAGKEHELMASRREQDLTKERIVNHYQQCTGLAKKTIIEKLMPASDVWLSADEAKRFKLCDEVKSL